jgi:uncharacterized MAPEG superfamily protein
MLSTNAYLQPMLLCYAISTLVLLVKQKFVNFYGVNQNERPPEDADLPKMPVPTDIARRQRALINDLENVPTDLAVFWAGALVVLAGAIGGTCVAEALALTILLPVYVGARVAFTYCYLAAKQPYRTIFFVLGMCSVTSAVGVLVSAAVKVAAL